MYNAVPSQPTDNSAEVEKIVGKSKLTEKMTEGNQEEERREIFQAICTLKQAACELYCEGDIEWDEMITELSAAILKLKGKEKDLTPPEQSETETEAA